MLTKQKAIGLCEQGRVSSSKPPASDANYSRRRAWVQTGAQLARSWDLSDQVKSGQWWSGQNRPTDVARDVILLAHFLLVRQVRFRAPAPWPAFQDVTVV
jgi:hypothetical protein